LKKTKYHSLSEISQEEFLKLFKGPLKKLLDYARSQRITIKPLNERIKTGSNKLLIKHVTLFVKQNIPIWIANLKHRFIFADVLDLELSSEKNRITALVFFPHEIAHIQKDIRPYLLNRCPSSYVFVCACPLLEYHCYKEGLKIIKKLGILIDEKSFWDLALRSVGCHGDFCPKFNKYPILKKNIYQIPEEHTKQILFWKKQKKKLGIKRVLEDYL